MSYDPPKRSVTTIDGSTVVASTSSPYQMLATDRVIDVNKTTGAPTSILLPINPAIGVEYIIKDGRGDATTNPITLAGANGVTIDNESTFLMNSSYDGITALAVSPTTWRIT